MSADFDDADIREMRRDGSLREFLRFQSRPTARPGSPGLRPPWRPPDHQPGAWPTGTRPPSVPVSAATAADWTAALGEYRAWAAEADHADTTPRRCDCGTCPPPEGARP